MSKTDLNGAKTHARDDHSYDVVIIGSGAGGATIAQRLASTGKSILILERGERLPVEPDNWDARQVFIKRKYRTTEMWRDHKGRKFHPNTHYWVGGNTSFYGAALMRLRKGDFGEVAHVDGASPAWPISYADLAPYYDEAEREWKVHGRRPEDPTDDPDAPAYAYPALAHDAEISRLRAEFEGFGWRPFTLPLGIDRDETQPWQGRCIRCKTCGGFPCLLRAKSDARRIVHEAEAAENVTLLTGRKVIRLETNASGAEVNAVVCETSDGEERFRGDIVVLAAGAINSAVVLLKSANGAHPDGLANGSDQVGRNYMFHLSSAVLSVTRRKTHATFPKTIGVNDFYWNDPEGGFDYPMGHIQLLEYMNGETIQGQAEDVFPPALFPDFVADIIARRILAFLVISEDLPESHNRVKLDRKGGIILDYKHGNIDGHERLVKKLEGRLTELGRGPRCYRQRHYQFDELLPLYGTAHQCGTLRMGDDPKSSVVDANCKAHQLDNLYVADSGVFVSAAAVNPTLTIVANAMRVGDHLRARLG